MDGSNVTIYDKAGITKDHFLVAPAFVTGASYTSDTGYMSVSGTSFSTPQVSGAAALVWQADPTLTADQVASILLQSATDLGAPGVDDVYGHGLLNLQAALQPLGLLGVPTGTTATSLRIDAMRSWLRLSPAFGDSLAQSAALAHVVALDDYSRPYYVDLRGAVGEYSPVFDLASHLQALQSASRSVNSRIGQASFTAGLQQNRTDTYLHQANASFDQNAGTRPYYEMSLPIGEGSEVAFANTSPSYLFGGGAMNSLGAVQWMGPTGLTNGFLGLVGDSQTAVFGGSLTDHVVARTGLIRGTEGSSSQTPVTAGVMEFTYYGDRQNTRLLIGQMYENGALLGAQSAGALGAGSRATTSMVGLSTEFALSNTLALVGHYSSGQTNVAASSGSMLRAWKGLRSSAYGMGLVAHDLYAKGSVVGLQYSRPLRVDSGSVSMNVPVYRDLAHNILRDTTPVNLAPSGQERDLELTASAPVGKRFSIAGDILYREQPGNVASQGAETLYLVSLKTEH